VETPFYDPDNQRQHQQFEQPVETVA